VFVKGFCQVYRVSKSDRKKPETPNVSATAIIIIVVVDAAGLLVDSPSRIFAEVR
jgi:hypothetical protein